MSKGRRTRRPGGHPAKVAARREREARRAPGLGPDAIARRIAREAQQLTGALDAELWAASLLGTFWAQRAGLPLHESRDYALIYGGPLVEALARNAGPGALTALTALAVVDDGDLGGLAGTLAADLAGQAEAPAWLGDVGQAEITAAAVMREDIFDDGATMFLEARHPDGEAHVIGVYIDHNLGVMAKDILLADSIEAVATLPREHRADDADVRFERIGAATAAAEIHAAMDLTDMTLDPLVSEDYASLRALALLRADETPGGARRASREEVESEEREALREEFFASPEGRAFAPDGDEAFAVSLAIDFCADYVDGRPLRWSPVVVELFMADWVPRKVLTDAGLLRALPAALDAWVRFAGRKRGLPEWAIAVTREAIERWHPEMIEASNDPEAAGPTQQFLRAAQDSGVDLSDPDALATFVAGWNARSLAS